MKVVLMAGGRGTRISELFPDIPKPLIPIQGIPVLEREIISLRDQGFTDIILTIGYMAEKSLKPRKQSYTLNLKASNQRARLIYVE